MAHSMHNTKSELLAALTACEQQNMNQAHQLADMRQQLSIMQANLALRERERPRHEVLRPGVTVERHGQRVIKRYAAPALPVDSKV